MSDSDGTVARHELGEFLRSRRERLSPEDVGLPPTGRRRTPGLRREEVAVLASVGVTWYTWLEQGRQINVSAQVLTAISRALKLDAAEAAYVRNLAGLPPVASDVPVCDPSLLIAVQPVLDKLDPYPACVQTPFFDIVAYNRAYRLLFADVDLLPAADRNCAVQFFTDPKWRDYYLDPDLVAARMVAKLRAEVGAAGDRDMPVVVERLREESAEFARLWDQRDVLLDRYEVKQLNSPIVGQLDLNFVSTIIPDTNHRMTVMTPADGGTTQRLEELSFGGREDAELVASRSASVDS
ncbi:MAG TPA: helix-turn-helix transcriptional regulator [Candidatus Corynebacterium avicola]|uniref:Helix-turn-helix transcriptional regulator n=1 Tax=Candidatus Corynebacterium avicola TaxID=2838527 RepID=A0A9D1RPQ5_9CORY|nr:helix-turn-helix transcriptional regulator [Candidatus Corynebacterium avicola]